MADPEEPIDADQLAHAIDASFRELVELDPTRAARLAGAWLGAASTRAMPERDLEYPNDPRPHAPRRPRPQTHV